MSEVHHPSTIAESHNRRREQFAIKASMCRVAIHEARRLALIGAFASPLRRLVATAEELLDDLDDLLLALHPIRDAGEFARAGSLHRAMDELTELRRESASSRMGIR
jgi:hypothetical protein